MSFASMISQWSQGGFTGAMLTIDNIPPYFLGFPFAPDMIMDSMAPDFDIIGNPGSRYAYPVFKNGKPRIISFQLKFDAANSVTKGGVPKGLFSRLPRIPGGLGTAVRYAQHVTVAIAILEKMKLPKQGAAQVAQGVLGGFTKTRPGVSDPAPPLTLLALNPFKYFVGYLMDAPIRQIRFNRYMICTRVEVDCQFLVSPDLIATTVEDALREGQAALGWSM